MFVCREFSLVPKQVNEFGLSRPIRIDQLTELPVDPRAGVGEQRDGAIQLSDEPPERFGELCVRRSVRVGRKRESRRHPGHARRARRVERESSLDRQLDLRSSQWHDALEWPQGQNVIAAEERCLPCPRCLAWPGDSVEALSIE